MSRRAGLSLTEAIDQRFCAVQALEAQLMTAKRPLPQALRAESALFEDGPPEDKDCADRAMWFWRWLQDLPTGDFGPTWTPASTTGSPFGGVSGPAAQETERGGV